MMETTAIEFNNTGCHLIEKERYSDAIGFLSQALHFIRSDAATSCTPGGSARKREELHETPLHHQHIAPTTKIQHNGLFIFRTPIFLLQESSCTTSVYSSIVFNLAVSQHLLALSGDNGGSNNDRDSRLRGALKLYELVFVLQENCRDEFELPFTHCLGLINNCGQIYKGLNRDKKANRLFQKLLTTLMVLVEQGADEITPEMEGFISTTSHLILKSPAVARAA